MIASRGPQGLDPGRVAGIATDRKETREWHPADSASTCEGRRFRAYTAKHLDALTTRAGLGEAERLAVRAVGDRAALPDQRLRHRAN